MSDTVMLAPKLDLPAASALLIEMKKQTDAELVLDMSEVKHLGALCVQVLFAAATSAIAEGRKISLINPSDRVIDQLRLMGMSTEIISRGRQ